jgi:hypothetical protein
VPQLALAFPPTHPGVTSIIIGPRTMEQLESALAAASVTLEDSVLDQIDEIVPPGTDVYRGGAWVPPSLADPSLRRRPPQDRAAA